MATDAKEKIVAAVIMRYMTGEDGMAAGLRRGSDAPIGEAYVVSLPDAESNRWEGHMSAAALEEDA